MPQQFRYLLPSFASLPAFATLVFAGKPTIVVDDFGYRLYTENRVPVIPSAVSAAVLPNAPHAREIATKAHNSGHEVLTHLPMAPLSRQPLGEDTLHPGMNNEEIERIIRDAVSRVPNAVGLNNRMGSAMISDLFGAQEVIQTLEYCDLYLLDSMTIGNSQTMCAASGTGVKVIRRKIFLNDAQNETDIHRQSNRAAEPAHYSGSATATGHPHPPTVRVLQQVLYSLPADITLVHPSSLLNEPQVDIPRPDPTPPKNGTPDAPRNFFHGVRSCKSKQPLEPVCASRFFSVLDESIIQSALMQCMRLRWQGWQ